MRVHHEGRNLDCLSTDAEIHSQATVTASFDRNFLHGTSTDWSYFGWTNQPNYGYIDLDYWSDFFIWVMFLVCFLADGGIFSYYCGAIPYMLILVIIYIFHFIFL